MDRKPLSARYKKLYFPIIIFFVQTNLKIKINFRTDASFLCHIVLIKEKLGLTLIFNSTISVKKLVKT